MEHAANIAPISLVERERELLRQYNELRFAAPNPRDFPNWEAFYAAQAEHESQMAGLQRQMDECSPW